MDFKKNQRRYLYKAILAIGFMALASWAYWNPNGLRAKSGTGIVVDAAGNYYVTAPIFQGGTSTSSGPKLVINPQSLTFNNQQTGTTSTPQTVTLLNTGDSTLFGTFIVNGEFNTVGGSCFSRTVTTDITANQKEGSFFAIGANQNCTLDVVFSPQSGGPKTGDISFSTNAAGSSPKVLLSGNIGGILQYTTSNFTVNENAGSATITVSRTGGSGSTSVNFFTGNNTAIAGTDYTTTSGVLNFGGTENVKSFTVPILDNNIVDGNRIVTLFLSNPTNGSLGSVTVANLTIVDNDVATPGQLQFNSPNFTVNEGAGSATITLTRTGGGNIPVSVNFSATDGTGRVGVDTGAISGTVNFAPGAMSSTFNIRINDDIEIEPGETINLILSNPLGGAVLGNVNRAVLTILDNDSPANPPTLQVIDQSLDFGDVNVGQPARRTVTLRNSGGGQLVLTSPTVTGGAGSGFSISSPPAALTLGQGQSTTFEVTFIPQTIGSDFLTGVVAINSNGGSTTVALRGRGVDNIGPIVNIGRPRQDVSEIATAGLPLIIQFTGTDNVAVSSFTVSFSTDDGVTFPPQNQIGQAGPNDKQIVWNVPDSLSSNQVRIRVVARDTSGNMTSAISGRFVVRRSLLPPLALAREDFNGDGRLDLAVALSGSNSVAILLGTGAGSFGQAKFAAVDNGPVAITVGDFNGDGRLDLATANRDSNSVTVLFGDGAGNFGQAKTFSTGLMPTFIAVGDFNGDGRLDLVTANSGSNDISVLLNLGGGTFNGAANFPAGTQPESLAVGDFNRDNIPDVAVANRNSFNVTVLLGDGGGRFNSISSFAVGGNPVPITVGDFDGDGRLDLAAANRDFFNITVLLGDDTGRFNQPNNFSTGANPISLAVGDLNRDGRPDLITADFNADTVSVLLGTGMGRFTTPVSFPAGAQPESIVVGDFNGDGNFDLAVGNQLTNSISILAGTGAGSFGAPTTINIGSPTFPPPPSLQVMVRFDPPPPGQIAPPQNLRVTASEVRTSNITASVESDAEAELVADQTSDPQLVGFNIYRVPAREDGTVPTAEEIVGNPNNLVGSIPSNMTTFMDTVSTSKGNNFVYSATSFFGTGAMSNGSQPAGTELPVIKNPTFRKGSLFIDTSGSFISLTGATLIVNDTENFQLKLDSTGVTFTVDKSGRSSPGSQKLKKLLQKNIQVRLTVKNSDGKLSVGVMFTRTN
jgi:hypothetical protein